MSGYVGYSWGHASCSKEDVETGRSHYKKLPAAAGLAEPSASAAASFAPTVDLVTCWLQCQFISISNLNSINVALTIHFNYFGRDWA